MKKKPIRTMIISALVLLLAVTAILRIDIEPAEQTVPSSAGDSSPSVSMEDAAAAPGGETANEAIPPAEQLPEKAQPDPVQPQELSDVPEQLPTPPPAETPDVPADTPDPAPNPVEPVRHICTIEIRCDTVVDTSKLENQAVAPYVPADGIILAAVEMEYTPGESVFDILLHATKDKNIHMEFRDDNLYSGKYIEGINYLYEMDGGPLSGWMYKVNGQFPNYGCAAYEVKDGDAIVWIYTCDLGADVGDNSVW